MLERVSGAMKYWTWERAAVALFAAALSFSAVGCSDDGGDGGDFAAVEKVTLIADPQTITFESVSLNETSSKIVTVFNQSSATAQINFRIEESRTEDLNREFDWDPAMRERLSKTVTLEGGESMQLIVTYTPRDNTSDSGSIVAEYNGGQSLVIQLETNEVSPDIDGPSRLIFGRVPANNTVTKTMVIQNVGRAPLKLNDMYLGQDAEEFSFCFPRGEGDDAQCLGIDEEGAYPETLEYLDTVQVRVTYSPTNDGEDSTEFIVESNDPIENPFSITISANGAEPCIIVSDENGIDFGASFIGGVSQRTITIQNCSPNKELEVSSIVMTPESDEQFFIDPADLPNPLPDELRVIDPEESASFVISYAPEAEAANQGSVQIRSNDAAKDPLTIPVTGRGSTNSCPTAVASARVQGDGGPALTQLETIPLATIQFDGTDSNDPDSPNGIASYEWTIVERPADSTTRFVPNNSVANPSLFIDLAGRYTVQLRVYDQQNTASCEVAEVTILATPNEDIHVQLVWDTDGTDVDLHLLHPNGRWNASPYDCYWLNREPNWANVNASDDNPSLDIDDVDGFGPENINLDNPENVTYRVGVHYYSDHFLGASNATVRIWLASVLVYESGNRFMTDGQFWDVATIDWGVSPSVNEIQAPNYPTFP